MTNYLLIPGLGNSGPEHWQTYFQNSGTNFYRIEQQEWEAPTCQEWVATIDKKISEFDLSTVVLVGHSLGCSTIAHWATKYKNRLKVLYSWHQATLKHRNILFRQQVLHQFHSTE